MVLREPETSERMDPWVFDSKNLVHHHDAQPPLAASMKSRLGKYCPLRKRTISHSVPIEFGPPTLFKVLH